MTLRGDTSAFWSIILSLTSRFYAVKEILVIENEQWWAEQREATGPGAGHDDDHVYDVGEGGAMLDGMKVSTKNG